MRNAFPCVSEKNHNYRNAVMGGEHLIVLKHVGSVIFRILRI